MTGVPVGMAGGASQWNRGPTRPARPPPAPGAAPRAPSKVGIFPSTPFLELEGVENLPLGRSGVPLNPEHPSAEGSSMGLVPLPGSTGCARALPKENHNLQCQGAALL